MKTMALGILVICTLAGGLMSKTDSKQTDFDKFWNYNNPTETREKFLEHLNEIDQEADKDYLLQLQTQIARTYGLDGQFDSAHSVLNRVQSELNDKTKVAHVRYLLERGRAFRSSGNSTSAKPLFLEAFEYGEKLGLCDYTVDAAHMMALVVETRESRTEWNLKGVKIAEESNDLRCRHWLGSIYNNIGWDFHNAQEYYSALKMFQKALKARLDIKDKLETIEIAKWCLARCYRSLEENQKALEIQMALFNLQSKEDRLDGYVCEELGELYLLLGDKSKAAENFSLAFKLLSKDSWFVKNEAKRLERIQQLSEKK
jgi:tetratricopeptide (TPR) repeat protein